MEDSSHTYVSTVIPNPFYFSSVNFGSTPGSVLRATETETEREREREREREYKNQLQKIEKKVGMTCQKAYIQK